MAAKKSSSADNGTVQIRPLETCDAVIPIVGISPVIMHKWSEKAKRMMREKQSGATVRSKPEPRSPEEEALACCYVMGSGEFGLPASGFKTAIVNSARNYAGVTMVELKQWIYVIGESDQEGDQFALVPLTYGKMTLREDMVRNHTGVADIRYRMQFYPWSAELQIQFFPEQLQLEGLVNLVDAAGLTSGIGDGRPSSPQAKAGTFGRWRVDQSKPVRVLAAS
jgi:hypothetical protein